MADNATIPDHALFLAAATVGNTGDSIWDARVQEYLQVRALVDADCEFGRLAEANEVNARKHYEAKHKFGPAYLSNPQARAMFSASAEICQTAEERWTEKYCRPLWAAGRALVQTPAPTMAAALFKIDIIRRDEIWNDGAIEGDMMEIITRDMERLSAPNPDQDILNAWERRQQAYAVYNALPFNEDIGGDPREYSPEERVQWSIIDAAEVLIRETTAKTLQGIVIQLLVSLAHMTSDRAQEAAITATDIPAILAYDADLDWHQRMVLAAIRSLQTMGAAS